MKTIDIPVQVPDWAKWVAQDSNGEWWAHEDVDLYQEDGEWLSGGRVEHLRLPGGTYSPNWRETLRKIA